MKIKEIEIIRPSCIRIIGEDKVVERYIPLPEVEALDFARQVARDEGYDVPCDFPVADLQFTSRMDLSKITTSPIAKNHRWVK